MDGIILGGDFNCYEKNLDKFGGNATIADYLTDARMRKMTWFNSVFSIGSRLDQCFISNNLEDFVDKRDISPCCLSDQTMLILFSILLI